MDLIKSEMGEDKPGLSSDEESEIHMLAIKKYESWEWTYGYFSGYELEKRVTFPDDTLSVRLTVRKGVIDDVEVTSENNDKAFAIIFFLLLHNTKHSPEDLFAKLRFSPIFHKLSDKEVQHIAIQLF
jgi:hypothetical protein